MNVGMIFQRAIPVAHRDLLAFFKFFYTEIMASILTPIFIVVAFSIGVGDKIEVEGMSYTVFLVAGMTMIPVMTSAFSGAGVETYLARKETQLFGEILALPMPIESYALGRILACSCLGLIEGSIVGIVAILIVGKVSLVAFLLATPLIFLTGVLFSSLGMVGGMLVDRYYKLEALRDVITLPLMFFSAVYFPLSYLSGFARTTVYYLPLTPYVESWRSLVVGGASLESMASEIALALGYALFAAISAVFVVRWLSARQ